MHHTYIHEAVVEKWFSKERPKKDVGLTNHPLSDALLKCLDLAVNSPLAVDTKI